VKRFRTFSAFDRTRPFYKRRFGRTDYLWDGYQWYNAKSGRPAPPKRNLDFCRRTIADLDESGFCAEETVQAGRQAFDFVDELPGTIDAIETVARQLLRFEPDHPAGLRVLCAALRVSEQPLRALHATAGRGRQDPRLLAARSAALFHLGRFGGARVEIEKALALQPDPEMLYLRELIRQAA